MSEHLDFRTDSYRKGIVISGTRSALSKELGKMRKDGLIEYNKNIFVIKTHIA
ncbi:MAG: winged helix-turn-helix domain-containing protein [Lachnospiraceae bacterium]|nr:winged helix-turn-helix domain-containing protein [Lachnospiraceae bacterium]